MKAENFYNFSYLKTFWEFPLHSHPYNQIRNVSFILLSDLKCHHLYCGDAAYFYLNNISSIFTHFLLNLY
jgi:hypothetical protein